VRGHGAGSGAKRDGHLIFLRARACGCEYSALTAPIQHAVAPRACIGGFLAFAEHQHLPTDNASNVCCVHYKIAHTCAPRTPCRARLQQRHDADTTPRP
jgi:hypothetical protein